MGGSGNGIQNTAPLQKINFVKLVKRPATLFLGARLVKRAGKKNAIRGCWNNVTTFRAEAPILLTATDEAGSGFMTVVITFTIVKSTILL